MVLQEAAEGYITGLFADSRLCTSIGKRTTVEPEDLRSVQKFRGERHNNYKHGN